MIYLDTREHLENLKQFIEISNREINRLSIENTILKKRIKEQTDKMEGVSFNEPKEIIKEVYRGKNSFHIVLEKDMYKEEYRMTNALPLEINVKDIIFEEMPCKEINLRFIVANRYYSSNNNPNERGREDKRKLDHLRGRTAKEVQEDDRLKILTVISEKKEGLSLRLIHTRSEVPLNRLRHLLNKLRDDGIVQMIGEQGSWDCIYKKVSLD